MSIEEKKEDPTFSSNSSDASTQPEGTGEKSSSPTEASSGNEAKLKELESKLNELTTKYSESSREAKRLKSLYDELEDDIRAKEEYISSLEDALESAQEKDEKESDDTEAKTEKKEEKSSEEKSSEAKSFELPPHLTKEAQQRQIKAILEQEREEEKEAERQYQEALENFPRLKNRGFSKLVADKMKIEKVGVMEACKKVEEDLKSLGETESEEEPFIEGGKGKSSPSVHETEEDKIRKSLRRDSSSHLPGML